MAEEKKLNLDQAIASYLPPEISPHIANRSKITDDEGYGYGLGVERFPTPFGESFGHTGTAYGFVTLMAYLPNKDTTVIVLLNDQDIDIKAIMMKAIELVNSR